MKPQDIPNSEPDDGLTLKTQDALNAALAASPSPARITPELIKDRIEHVEYHRVGGGTLTLCVITVNNGFQVTGTSACADPENYNKDIGQKIAFDNAFRELWPLFGFLLREKLFLANARG